MARRSSQSTSPSQSRSTSTETAAAAATSIPPQASCTEHPHSASTRSDGQLLAVHGQLLAVHGQLLAVHGQLLAVHGQLLAPSSRDSVVRSTATAICMQPASMAFSRWIRARVGRTFTSLHRPRRRTSSTSRPLPTRSRSIVIVLVDLDVVVDLDGDGDVDRDTPSWTVRSSSSACAAVSARPAPRAFGKVAHDGLRGTSELVSASTTVRRACRRGRGTRWRVGRRSPRRRRSQGPRPRKLPQQQRRAAPRQASCTQHPHSASTRSDGQLLAVHGQLLAPSSRDSVVRSTATAICMQPASMAFSRWIRARVGRTFTSLHRPRRRTSSTSRPLPTRSRSIVIVLVDLDVVVGLDGDGDVDRDTPSWTVRSSFVSMCCGQRPTIAPRLRQGCARRTARHERVG
jgi:hypothetical protein